MSNSCKGICIRYKSKIPANKVRYDNGQKFCSICKIYFDQDDLRCKCCKTKLRTKARSSRCKRELPRVRIDE